VRVTCESLHDFITNLRHEPPTNVVQRIVYISTTRRPMDSDDKHKAVLFTVVLQSSAVVNLDDGGQYHLEYGEECGVDVCDATQELCGSDKAAILRKRLVDFCDEHGLHVRPGIVET